MAGVNIKECCCESCFCIGIGSTTWSVTFFDVENNMPCTNCPTKPSGPYLKGDGNNFSGTYTLTVRPGDCEWRDDVSAPTAHVNGGSGGFFTDCADDEWDGTAVSSGTTRIELFTFASTLYLRAEPVAGLSMSFFTSTISSVGCCATHTFPNDQTSYACIGPDSSKTAVGINGYAVATPGCAA